MGENAITYGSIGIGLLIFAAIFGIFWSVIDSRSKAKAEAAKVYAEDKLRIHELIDKVETSCSAKVAGVYKSVDEMQKDNTVLNRQLGQAEGALSVIVPLIIKNTVFKVDDL